MLFGSIVHNDIQLIELINSLLDGLSAKLFLADVAFDQQAFPAVLFHQILGFIRIFPLFQVNDRDTGALRDHVWPDASFVPCRALEAATLLPPAALSTIQWQSPALASAHHVCLPECAPSLRAQTRPPGCSAPCLHVHLRALVRLFLLLA